jgi:hypothetical protein
MVCDCCGNTFTGVTNGKFQAVFPLRNGLLLFSDMPQTRALKEEGAHKQACRREKGLIEKLEMTHATSRETDTHCAIWSRLISCAEKKRRIAGKSKTLWDK